RRPWPPPGHDRLHSASCCVQVLGHAAVALPRGGASDRPTIPARNSSTRCDSITAYCDPLRGVNATAGVRDQVRLGAGAPLPPPTTHGVGRGRPPLPPPRPR